jgi:hypothetical protein
LTFEYKLPLRRNRTLPPFPAAPAENHGTPLRLARLLALAHQLEDVLRSGGVRDYAELARRAQVSPARIGQIVALTQLAPEIQEYVLFLSSEHAGLIAEQQLRDIARMLAWEHQRSAFAQLVRQRR